ncbi:MAG: hypothetical protein M1818_007062 [Claussenomyces sp. TS43310]|nr:MAG: hypothetical protein M1818_007062 [Claussenomyces sp. TS43310]
MFWRFGGYANISAIDTLLEKADVTLEDFLDESDLIQELKSHNTKLIEYLREDPILERLLEYVVAPKLEVVAPEEETADPEKDNNAESARLSSASRVGSEEEDEEKEKKRNRYAYVAAEILSSDSWSLSAALLENQALLRKFWGFLESPPPLDPLQASYFTKVNEALLDKKTEEMLQLFKSLDGVVEHMLQHVDSPMVMDLLLKIISLEKAEGGQGIVEWLHAQNMMPILLGFLSAEHSWATQTSAGDFLKAIITISANASQNEQSCIGPNELTRQLVSHACVEKLISDMLKGGNPLTVGVGIVIEVIRKNNSDYDPEVGVEANSAPSGRDPIYLGTLLRMFAKRVPDFMALILSPNHTIGGGDGPVTIRRKELSAAFGGKIEPLGFDRFKTCELMAELLHCSNMGLLNEVGSEEFIRNRDLERERLKAEGKLAVTDDSRRASEADALAMKSSTLARIGSESPDTRRLEVQNASDDDGFEEVTHATDLGDDAKDDFDEKPDADDLLTTTKPETPLSFMEKDDEEFVDEPLSSPRLNAETEHFKPEGVADPSFTVLPLSPSKELSNEVAGLRFNQDVDNDSTPASTASSAAETDVESLDTLEKITEDHLEILGTVNPETSSVESPQDKSSHQVEERAISPHPEDRPAPLFAKSSKDRDFKENAETTTASDTTPSVQSSSEDADMDMAEAGNVSNVTLIANSEDDSNYAPTDAPPIIPVVGDYLKIQFVEHKVVPTIIDFFFRFPWNNFLHNVVYDVVQQVFNGPMDRGFNRTLAIDLFENGDITDRIVDGQKASDEAQEKYRMRLGYMGHLTLIAEEVVKFTERHPPELLSESVLDKVMHGDWITYVEMTLAETRERDNAILGGVRPDMSVGPRQAVMNAVNAASGFGGGSAALADAGLNGSAGLDGMDLSNGGGASGGSYTLTGGSLLSGFGSSSDEEDEEMEEENDEDGSRNQTGGAEFSRYITTPSTTTATSEFEPPLAPPPPPPPLNIPPSRARRQLAARLALHSKQNIDSTGITAHDAERANTAGLNPFATDEDDEEDEDGSEDFTIGDLEAEAEGKGVLPPGTAMAGSTDSLDELNLGLRESKDGELNIIDHVGIPKSSSGLCEKSPTLWPLHQSRRLHGQDCQDGEGDSQGHVAAYYSDMALQDGDDGGDCQAVARACANRDDSQSSDSSTSSNEDDSDDDYHARMGAGEAKKARRLNTTEAKRRTSLVDDDEEDLSEAPIHVGNVTGSNADAATDAAAAAVAATGDDEELVEIQHAEMQGVDSLKDHSQQ